MSDAAPPDDELFVLTFAIDDAYAAAWRRTRYYREVERLGERFAAWVVYGGAIVVGLAAGAVAEFSGSVDRATSSWIAVGAALLYYAAILIGWRLSARAMRLQIATVDRDLAGRDGEVVVTVRKSGLAYAAGGLTCLWSWSEFTEARDDRDLVLLMRGSSPVLLIPKAAFPSEAEAETGVALVAELIRRAGGGTSAEG